MEWLPIRVSELQDGPVAGAQLLQGQVEQFEGGGVVDGPGRVARLVVIDRVERGSVLAAAVLERVLERDELGPGVLHDAAKLLDRDAEPEGDLLVRRPAAEVCRELLRDVLDFACAAAER